MRFIIVMAHASVVVMMFVGCITHPTNNTKVQSHRDEIDSLLEKLKPVKTKEGDTTRTDGPSMETQQNVKDSLISIANQTPESRAEVVEALIRVVQDPAARTEGHIAHRWTVAVNVLGDLKATEAINALIANLGETGQNGVVLSLSYHPVAAALAKIGAPAIPQLMEVWSSGNDKEARYEAEVALVNIGPPAIPVMQDALRHGDANERGRAAWVLGRIGGKESETVTKDAIANEKDAKVRRKLKGALEDIQNSTRTYPAGKLH